MNLFMSGSQITGTQKSLTNSIINSLVKCMDFGAKMPIFKAHFDTYRWITLDMLLLY